jgi:hypothetical protein
MLAATPTNYTPTDAAIVADHLAAIDVALGSITPDYSDSDFRIHDNGDATKKAAFEVSAIAGSTTRTITVPDRNVDLGKVLEWGVVSVTLSGTDITNKYVDLTGIGAIDIINPSVSILIVYGVEQNYTTDYTIITDGTYVRRLNWSGTSLDGVLAATDVIKVRYLKY